MPTVLDDFKPADFGLHQFADFRQVQREAVEQCVYEPERFQAIAPPTGSGKSLIAEWVHKLTGWRMAILTATKGLQDQYGREFKPVGLYDIRGRANYRCRDRKNMNCADGARAGCRLIGKSNKTSSCTYDIEKRIARGEEQLVTNYAYWLNVNDKGQGLEDRIQLDDGGYEIQNPFECLILDEAHSAPDELADYLAVRLYERDLKDLMGIEGIRLENLGEWVRYAADLHKEADIQLTNMLRILAARGDKVSRRDLDLCNRLEKLVGTLDKIKTISAESDEWVCEMKEGNPKYGRSWEFDVIWPGKYAEQYLFCGIPRIILMSATLRPKTMQLLGVKREHYSFREWPRLFPAQRNPIIYCPARKKTQKSDFAPVQLKYGTPEADLKLWIEQIDRIIEPRLDRKGLIPTVAYHRQEYLIKHSKFAKYMIGNTADPESETASQIYKTYCEALPSSGLILVSPSFSTGWDFPYTKCEYIIIPKIPFVPGQSRIIKARLEKDPKYSDNITMQELVQSCGRAMRHVDDQCEVFIVDGALDWWLGQNKSLAPSWFEPAIRRTAELPRPLKALQMTPPAPVNDDDIPF